jgi:hypothetical protein
VPVLGSLWMQNFQFYWTATKKTPASAYVQFWLSGNSPLPNAAITATAPALNATSAFSYVPSGLTLNVNVNNKTMVATVKANLGW